MAVFPRYSRPKTKRFLLTIFLFAIDLTYLGVFDYTKFIDTIDTRYKINISVMFGRGDQT